MRVEKELDKITYSQSLSLVLFTLYKMRDIPGYMTLSELPFLLDKDNCLKLLEFYGGKTITIPTKNELLDVIASLDAFRSVRFEHRDEQKVLSSLSDECQKIYHQIKDNMANYDFEY